MEIVGDYEKNGYALVRELIPSEVARAFMARFKTATGGGPIPISKMQVRPAVLERPAFDVSSNFFQPMEFFLWGLTTSISQILGREVLPTYDYFRIYREGDICKVHSDRPSSQHGVSLTLDYSDGEVWDLQIGKKRTETLYPLSDDFGGDAYESFGMRAGDAVIYQASHYPHGRMTPNPNSWSAHLFLFFVDKDGPYGAHAFDEEKFETVNFTFV